MLRDKYEVAEAIRNASEWDPDDCRELCELAGIEAEWDAADGEEFESVVKKAADILEVEIFLTAEQEQYEVMADLVKKLKAAGLWSHPAINRIWNVIAREADNKPAGEGGEILRLHDDMFYANESTKKEVM